MKGSEIFQYISESPNPFHFFKTNFSTTITFDHNPSCMVG